MTFIEFNRDIKVQKLDLQETALAHSEVALEELPHDSCKHVHLPRYGQSHQEPNLQ